jgi:dsRNA-specific ribonuclease
MEKEKIERIESLIGYCFSDKKYLIKAITHHSGSNEKKEEYGPYEDLAKFGDRILNFIVAEKLYCLNRIDEIETGHKAKNNFINNKNLMEKAIEMGMYPIRDFLIMGKGSKSDENIDKKEETYGDVIEAIVAAIYLDSEGNLAKIRKFILDKLKILN